MDVRRVAHSPGERSRVRGHGESHGTRRDAPLDRDKFADSFAGDLPRAQAEFMADSQVPWGVEALGGAVSQPAWRTKRAWYLIATDDRMIPPPAQHAMSERIGAQTVEVAASHSVYVSQPDAVADLIRQAARS
ncbi:alpha/beta fold hydrolase [Streptomyces sp. NPDC051366]|uniref:alpha/beta fold hydrolase n=1 Tax=Streptomyces sp. NPDC051366 TaxID=3365652 RepID=UPI0037A8B648